jgi:hypothetical protein
LHRFGQNQIHQPAGSLGAFQIEGIQGDLQMVRQVRLL